MKFFVEFRSEETDQPISHSSTDLGISGVDQIRAETALKELSTLVMDSRVASNQFQNVFEVEENHARKSALFLGRNSKCIWMKQQTEAEFWYKKIIKIQKEAKTGAITEVQLGWAFDKEAALKAWAEAGYPEVF